MFNGLVPNLLTNGNNGYMLPQQQLPPHTPINGNGVNGIKLLLELESDSTLTHSISNLLKGNFFDKRALSWRPSKFEFVVNHRLTQEFEQIKNEFKSNAKELIEYEEKYAFLIQNESQVIETCQNGYHCQDNFYSVIGQSKSGVYLCRHPDVAIKFNEAKKYIDPQGTFKMVIFKICFGKQTTALVRKDAKLPPISATPNFNSHISVIQPREKDDIEVQFDHSQIYLYELDANKIASKRPRHCQPYAVVTWSKSDSEGLDWPFSFVVEDLNSPTNEDSLTNGTQHGIVTEVTSNGHIHNSTLAEVSEFTNTESIQAETTENQENQEKNSQFTEQAIFETDQIPNTNSPAVQQQQQVMSEQTTTTAPENSSTVNEATINENSEALVVENSINIPDFELTAEQTITTSENESNIKERQTAEETGSSGDSQNQLTAPQQIENVNNNNESTTTTINNNEQQVEITETNLTVTTTTSPNGTNTAAPGAPTTPVILPVMPVSSTTPTSMQVASTATTHSQHRLSYPRPTAYSAYRHPSTYLAAAANSFGAIRLPYGVNPAQHLQLAALQQQQQQQQLLQVAAAQVQQQQAAAIAAAQLQQQPQVYLCRGPNGLTYLATANGQPVQPQQAQQIQQHQQLVAQAQAQVILQQQQQQQAVAQAQALALALKQQQQQLQHQPQPFQLAGLVPAVVQAPPPPPPPSQPPVAAQQIVYQAGPQPPGGSVKPGAQSAGSQPSMQQQQQQQQPTPTQSPKQSQQAAANQVASAQQQQAAVNAQYAAQLATVTGGQSNAAYSQQLSAAYGQQQQQQQAYLQAYAAAAAAQQQPLAASGQTAGYYGQQNSQQYGQQQAALQQAQQQQQHQNQQQQQLQQLQQLQQQQLQLQQLQQQQLIASGAGSVNLNAFAALQQQQQVAHQSQAQQQQQFAIAAPGGGYQIVDYKQLQQLQTAAGAAAAALPPPGAIGLDQLGLSMGMVRPQGPRPASNYYQVRHHPYQRN